MSIQVYAATSVEPLAKQLAKEINNNKSVFQSDYIVSDNKGGFRSLLVPAV